MPKDWSQLYLLGWYDSTGTPMLSTWEGDLPMVGVVVYGVNELNMPLWYAPVPAGASFEIVPPGENGHEYAKRKGGLYAIGWYVERSFERKDPRRLNRTPFPDQLN